MLESPNKENFNAHHGNELSNLDDSSLSKSTHRGGPSHPYHRGSFHSANHCNDQKSYDPSPSNGQNGDLYSKSTMKNTSSNNNISPTLTQDQIQRMEENRQRALAIRMKKQQGLL